MTDVLPTVKVKNDAAPDGFMIINESDLSNDHELFEEAPPPPPAPVGSDAPKGGKKPDAGKASA